MQPTNKLGTRPGLLAALLLLGLGAPADAATGGPDSAGYTWADSTEPGQDLGYPPFQATDIRALGFSGDERIWPLTLPGSVFPTGFPFYGRSYTSLWVSSNGWLSFVDPANDPVRRTATIPSAGNPGAMIAFFWDDWSLEALAPQALAGPHLGNDGYTLVIRYALAQAPGYFSQLRVILWTNGVIKVIWNDNPEQMLTASTMAGIENETGTIGLPFVLGGAPQNGARLTNGGYAVTYYPRGSLDCGAAPTSISCPAGPIVSDNLAPLRNSASVYGCTGGSWDGNERVFELSVPQLSSVTLKLDNTDGKNRALFLIGPSCSELSECIAGGAPTLEPGVLAPGTYYVVVDGATSADSGSFSLETLCASATQPLSCGESRTGESLSGTGILDQWSCNPLPMPGAERIYEVDVPSVMTLRATLSNPTVSGLHALVTPAAGFDVNAPSCGASSPTTATYFGARGKMLVAVDGVNAGTGGYDIQIECLASLTCPSPPKIIDLTNPAPVAGNTTGLPATTDSYFCANTTSGGSGNVNGLTGPEDIWEFTITTPQVVSFLLTSPNPNLRALLLQDCYEGSCVSDRACGENLQPGTYRVVVDGLAGAAGPYQLTPFVLPPVAYNLWTSCPECKNSCGQSSQVTRAKKWQFDSENYCGTGCDFSLFAVVECGTEFHLPFYDVETGRTQVWDVYNQRPVSLEATNNDPSPSCLHEDSGTSVSWLDQGCRQSPCPSANCGGGSDCHTNGRVMDVSFKGTPSVCGIYRVDFLNWGGYVWEAYANCSGDATELYYLYRDLCSALADYNPLPEIAITNVYIDNTTCGGAGDAQGTIELTNIGCLPVASVEVEIAPTTPPGPPARTVISGAIDKGASVIVPWSFPVPIRPYSLTFTVDPLNLVAECSEGLGGAVRCGKDTTGKREWQAAVCGSNCNTLARSGPRATVCTGSSFELDGSTSRFQCTPTAVQQYRWEDSSGSPLPGCDWGTNPNCLLDPAELTQGTHDYTLRTRCFGDLPCESQAYAQVEVSLANIQPESLGNTLWGHRAGDDAVWWWPPAASSPIAGYRIYKDGDPRLPGPTRLLAASAGALEQTATDAGAVSALPAPLAFYQAVAHSCRGDLESPY